jgi:3-deoxy-D-manno-octulosonate 8-phosphate phosphatase KdsC-like HAD superfamily phosphatase
MKILIGMPCIRQIPTRTVISLLQTVQTDVDPYLVSGSLVYDARDEIAKFAVKEGYDYVLYVDSDMIFNANDIM